MPADETATLGVWQARQHLVRDVSQGVVESLVASVLIARITLE